MGLLPEWFDQHGTTYNVRTEYRRICEDAGDGRHESTMIIKRSDLDGPNIVVVGGMHGGEPAGAEAAAAIAQRTPDVGTLAVIPKANPAGLRNRQRGNTYGHDLNDCFTAHANLDELIPHAQALWHAVDAGRPDVVIDLHTSRWPRSMRDDKSAAHGQAIYPAKEDRGKAKKVGERVSSEHIQHGDNLLSPEWQDKRSRYYFEVGNNQGDRDDVALIDRVIYQLGISGYLVEVARNGVPYEARVSWHTAVVEALADEYGMSLL